MSVHTSVRNQNGEFHVDKFDHDPGRIFVEARDCSGPVGENHARAVVILTPKEAREVIAVLAIAIAETEAER